MSDNDTPLTDALFEEIKNNAQTPDYPWHIVRTAPIWKHAAQLEKQLAEANACLREWVKWADMGIEDFLPDWVKPVLNKTYDRTKETLK